MISSAVVVSSSEHSGMVRAKSRAIVFANGELDAKALQRAKITDNDCIVCVDGGLAHALEHQLQPHLLVGDFDSASHAQLNSEPVANVERINHPAKKDASDLELALLELEQRNVNSVVLLGISGGRTDHSLFNWMLPARKAWRYSMRLLDASTDAHVLTTSHPFSASCQSGSVLSLLPLTAVEGVSTSGLEYPLDAANLLPGSTLGLSNVVGVSGDVDVSLASGVILVLVSY